MTPSVAIILVNWNSFDVTHDCIQSLQASTYPSFTIIIVDNCSTDGSGERIHALHPGIVYIRSGTNTGFTGGNNIGFRYSLDHGFDYSMMLNNDTIVDPGFIQPLADYMESHPDTGAVQSRIYFNHNRNLIWNGGSYFNKWAGFTYTKGESKTASKEHLQLKQVDWITGCAFFIKNSVLRETGLLAYNMFIYCEDTDLSFRIRKKGYHLMYIPESVIYHLAGMSNKSKTKGKEGYVNAVVHYLNQRNRLWVLKKYTRFCHVPTVVISNFFYILMVMCYFAVRGRFGKLKAVTKAVRDGILGSIKYN